MVRAVLTLCKNNSRSMESVSIKAGLSKDTLSQWAAGRRTPKLQNMRAVLAVLGLRFVVVPL